MAPGEVHVTTRNYTLPAAKFTVESKLVEVGLTVRDAKGRPIAGLRKEDFHLFDNDKERPITTFSATEAQESPARNGGDQSAPVTQRSLAIFFDDVNQKDEQYANDLKQTQTAAIKFFKNLSPDTQIAIFTASGTVALDFTADPAKLADAVTSIRPHMRMSQSGLTHCPRITPFLAFLISKNRDSAAMNEVRYQARADLCPVSVDEVKSQADETWRRITQISSDTLDVISQAVDHLAARPGSRVLLLASSGFLSGSLEERKDAIINRALRAGVVVNSLDAKGLTGEMLSGGRPHDGSMVILHGQAAQYNDASLRFSVIEIGRREQALNAPMVDLADATGGTFYHNNSDLEAGFRELSKAPETAYHLTFTPDDIPLDGLYHKLKVTVSQRSYVVKHRQGYFAPTALAAESKFDIAVKSSDTVEDFPVDISGELVKDGLAVVAIVDISKLRFVKQNVRSHQKIRFVSILLNAKGTAVAGKEAVMDLSLKDASYARLTKSGLNAKITLAAPPGMYKLREVVEDEDHKLAASTHDVEIP